MRVDLLSLKLFVAVCEHRSIARAADAEHIAASAVSKRISDLEEMLKAPLFHRTPKALEPTPSALALLRHARNVMRDLKEMENELLGHAKGVFGQVRVRASVSTIVQHLPEDLAPFVAKHPGIRIDLEEGTSRSIVKAVEENAADLGIFGGCVPAPGLTVLPYRSDRLVVIAGKEHPLAGRSSVRFSEVIGHDLIGPQLGSFLDTLLQDAAGELDTPLGFRVRVSGFETVASMVEAGLGVGLVSEHCARNRAPAGRLVPIHLDEEWAIRRWKLCVRDVPSLPSSVRLLVQHLSPAAAAPKSRALQQGATRERAPAV